MSDDESEGPLLNGKQVLELCDKQIKKQDVSQNIKLNQYYFTLQQLFKQAETYNKEGSIEYAYIKYKQFCMYFIYTITKHKDYHTSTYAKEKATNQKLCNDVMDVLELLKDQIIVKHDQNVEYQTKLRAEEKITREIEKKRQEEDQKAAAAAAARAAAASAASAASAPAPPPVAPLSSQPTWDNLRLPSQDKPPQQPQQKPKSILKKSVHFNLETKHRRIHIPATLMQQFMDLAAANTAQSIETCGILTGELRNNELYVTHVILPKQHGTPNTCVTHDEEELIGIQTQQNLLTLGWIHTHPSQACFLSSIDLHTHYSYQIMLPEAIAIVMAPTVQPNYGVFNVTKHGMDVLSQCTRSGFHHHGQDTVSLFEPAAHAMWDHNIQHRATFIDLREKGGAGGGAGGGGHVHTHQHSHGSQQMVAAAPVQPVPPMGVAFPSSSPAPTFQQQPPQQSAPPPVRTAPFQGQVQATSPPPAFNPAMLQSAPPPSTPLPSAPPPSAPSAPPPEPTPSIPPVTTFERPHSMGRSGTSPPRFNAHLGGASTGAPTFL